MYGKDNLQYISLWIKSKKKWENKTENKILHPINIQGNIAICSLMNVYITLSEIN